MQLGLVGDDRDNSDLLAGRLIDAGYLVHRIGSVDDALRHDATDAISAFLFDLGGGSRQAAHFVAPLRKAQVAQPLLVLSSRGDWREKVDCLDAGADDYVIKPVRSEEIVARLRAIIRRSAGSHSNRLRSGDLTLDIQARCAWLGTRCLDLTRSEFRLLRLFLFQPDRTLSQQEIGNHLYSTGTLVSPNAVEVQIARLRRKVGQLRIRTVRGVGYRYIPEPLAEPGADYIEPYRAIATSG